MPPPRTLVVAAALVDDLRTPSRLLGARRTGPAALAGRWELPGGKVEPGEEPLAALHRELAEELGVGVAVADELAGPADGWPISPTMAIRVWLAAVVEGDPAPSEVHDELRWLASAELDGVDWLPADLPIVALLKDRLGRAGGPEG